MWVVHTEDGILTICSIYAPTQDRPRDQVEFIKNLQDLLSQLHCAQIMLGGDFNCITDVHLDKNTAGEGHPQGALGRSALRSLKKDWGLGDIWRIRHPQERDYTFRRGSYSSRLNLFLISNQLADITDHAKIVILHASDHSLIDLQFSFGPSINRGPGFWKFPPELLGDQRFVSDMIEFFQA